MIHLLKPETKQCHKCGEWLPLEKFPKNAGGKNGLNCWCKSCTAAYKHDYYEQHKEKLMMQNKANKLKRLEQKQTLTQQEFLHERMEFLRNVCGGYKIAVLNYAKKNEFKYNIERTDGRVFCTNNKEEFLTFLEKRL